MLNLGAGRVPVRFPNGATDNEDWLWMRQPEPPSAVPELDALAALAAPAPAAAAVPGVATAVGATGAGFTSASSTSSQRGNLWFDAVST